ncbi:gamma-glutamylcyclotransferase [Bordetella genomosp. 9]|uniref:glutathione-specific gamma-glutamylcyclotransferase n=1 Tax=Bordetella genomosp. 9 TaxID=1416803 RepID=A0A261R691_9BORD|nr:gamma-glutamylcyclotransferase [Bordetella genomosp. 9]OZI20100.1 gamma-glutamylcyclotransferase [Bordetella genomosp. 9]
MSAVPSGEPAAPFSGALLERIETGCTGAEAALPDGFPGSWDGKADLWVFAYGSLIWRPGFPWQERRLASIHGYHRSLCLWSRHHRGSDQAPGLVFGLNRGGCCRGVVFRIGAADVPAAFAGLWEREMIGGAYTPRWLVCHSEQGPVAGLAFLLNRACADYAGDVAEERRLDVIRTAVGRSGACLDYVLETERALRDHGISDCRLGALVRRLVSAF